MTPADPPRRNAPAAAATANVTSSSTAAAPVTGRLEWRRVLDWLRDDGLVSAADAARVAKRFGVGDSSLPALVRLGAAGLLAHGANSKPLDTEALTEWLARRAQLPYLRIDPLKVDVGRVAEVMSVQYAELRKVLPVTVNAEQVTVATSEPYDTAWVAEIETSSRRRVRLVVANPEDIARYTTEFYSLARSVRAAQKTGEVSATASFEQLVELGRTNKQLDANDQGVVQVVDWLWQYAFDQRASDIHLEPRRDQVHDPLPHRRRAAHGATRCRMTVMGAMTARIKLLGRMDVVERRRPQDGRIKTRRPDNGDARWPAVARWRCACPPCPPPFGEKLVMRIFDPEARWSSPSPALGFERPMMRVRWASS